MEEDIGRIQLKVKELTDSQQQAEAGREEEKKESSS